MNNQISKLLAKSLILVLIPWSSTFAITKKKEKDELEGYQVKFDYEGYPLEREIVYNFFADRDKEYFSKEKPLKKNEIGIDLYDIDKDGYKEILVYLNHAAYCGSGGCTFEILKKIKGTKLENKYFSFLRTESNKEGTGINSDEDIKILDNYTLGVHDILFSQMALWKWQGKYYKLIKITDKNNR